MLHIKADMGLAGLQFINMNRNSQFALIKVTLHKLQYNGVVHA